MLLLWIPVLKGFFSTQRYWPFLEKIFLQQRNN